MNKDFKYKNTVGIESTYPKDMPKDHSEIPCLEFRKLVL